ncbi:MAG: ATP-dependent helicase, partial [Bacteriovoracia bacterium]
IFSKVSLELLAAAKEMKERVTGILGRRQTRGITMSTFHSLGVRVLKQDIDKLGYHPNFSIYDQSDQMGIIREALKNYEGGKAFDRKIIAGKIGNLKNRGITADEYQHTSLFCPDDDYDVAVEYVYKYYQDKLQFCNAIDFDDILLLVVRLFKEHPEVAEKFSKQYQYIMIDEYQDTNPLQFQIVLGLTSTHNNLCVVGDDDQSIYAFRGADIRNILDFEKYFEGAKIVKLEENYRSTSHIIKLANRVIKENKDRKDKTMFSRNNDGVQPILWAMGDTDHEAAVIMDEIVKHQRDGGHLGDIAILYRSNTQVPPIEDALRLGQVPYTIIGGQKFYEKKEVKDLIAYLSVIFNPSDELSLRRILNIPNRGIGNKTLQKYLDLAKEEKISLFASLEKTQELDTRRSKCIKSFVDLIRKYQKRFAEYSLAEALSTLIEDLEYYQYIEKGYDNPKQITRRKNDVINLIESAERFQSLMENAGLENFLERLLLADSQTNEKEDDDPHVRPNEVTLMTLHSSKGLEFEIVYLFGMEEESLPHKKTINEGGDISEERRLCYVGITRAKQKLIMTYCKERKIYGKLTPRHKSRFIAELDDCITEQDRTCFGHMNEEEVKEYKKSFFGDLIKSLG